MKKKNPLIGLLLLFSLGIQAQNPRYLIQLEDKNKSLNPYSLDQPGEFLSDKAMQRRANQNIDYDIKDLPIAPGYLDSLLNLGVKIQNKSKWMNSVVAEIDSANLDKMKNLSFVDSVFFLAPPRNKSKTSSSNKGTQTLSNQFNTLIESKTDTPSYGYSANQIMMLNGHILHYNGYEGQNKTIAVMDAGFKDVDKLPAFDSLWKNNQILGTKDFEDNDNEVFDNHAHGTYVLAIMAGNIPGILFGAAPKADYWLFRTEVSSSEFLIEEYNWIAAAEFADSAGVDIINTSLGYSTFDSTSQNHSYADMDGNTTPISRAADIAASKGILVVVSAGNKGNSSWHYITAPADADSVITVGAVDSDGEYVSFSSTGPSADGRVKPDVAAQGQGTAFQNTDSSIVGGPGTSFSAPIISGLASCLWQYKPAKSNVEIIQLIRQNANQYNNPDSLSGYGLPDFGEASGLEYPTTIDTYLTEKSPKVYPNPFQNSFTMEIPKNVESDSMIQIEIFNVVGNKVYSKSFDQSIKGNTIKVSSLKDKSPGIYFIKVIYDKNSVIRKKILKTD